MFADHYGFDCIPCRVRKPQEKGKTESGIKYVKNNFLAGRTFENEDDLNQQLREWLDTTCNNRVHGTTRKSQKKSLKKRKRNPQTYSKRLLRNSFLWDKEGLPRLPYLCRLQLLFRSLQVCWERS